MSVGYTHDGTISADRTGYAYAAIRTAGIITDNSCKFCENWQELSRIIKRKIMLKQVIEKWDKNKLKLKEYFATHPETDYDEYEKIVRLIADIILERKEAKIVEVEQGFCQGDVAFVLYDNHIVEDYNILFTYTDYGSCSGCDTLMGILAYNYDSDLPTKEQVKGLMTLSMHLVQRMTGSDYSVGVDDYEDDDDD